MATIFLRSTDGNDGDDGSTWALAKATIAAAVTAAGAGGLVYMSQVHAETSGSAINILSPGLPASPVRIICANDAAEPPTARATTGTVTTTGTGSGGAIGFAGCAYYYGVTFDGNDDITIGNSSTVENWLKYDTCKFDQGGGVSTDQIIIGTNSGNVDTALYEFFDCDFVFSSTLQELTVQSGYIRFQGGSMAATGTVPDQLFLPQGIWVDVLLTGVDLSAFVSGDSLVNVSAAKPSQFRFVDCKLGASVTLTTGTIAGQGGVRVEMTNSDSGDTVTRYERSTYQGTEKSDTAIFLNASDGSTSFSRQMVTGANAKTESPMESQWCEVQNTDLTQQTITVEIVHDNATDLTDIQCWLELEFMGTSGFPLGVFVSDRLDDFIFGTPTDQPASLVTWTGTGGCTNENKQKLEITFTALEIGPLRYRVMLADPSKTLFFDPDATVV